MKSAGALQACAPARLEGQLCGDHLAPGGW